MAIKIFINLPVKNVDRSVAFFTSLGYTFDPQFTNERAGCLVINEHIYAMLVTEPMFKTFIKKEMCDSSKYTESIMSLSLDSKEQVDELVNKAMEAGGTASTEPVSHGDFMYQWGFYDPDGHQWEAFFMDRSKFPKQ